MDERLCNVLQTRVPAPLLTPRYVRGVLHCTAGDLGVAVAARQVTRSCDACVMSGEGVLVVRHRLTVGRGLEERVKSILVRLL